MLRIQLHPIHFAFLSIATEQGLPLRNPITWTWRDLCRRMDIAYAGKKTINELKQAIRSTHGIVIHSQYALYSRKDDKALPVHERGHHLYSDYAFCNEPLSDGTVAERNGVWLADWYLDNLNSLYSAPLDYALWQQLESRSPIASRLYEFLLFNFYSGTPLFRINYSNLARLLPVRIERYLSDAKEQIGPALNLLFQTGVVTDARWMESRDGLIQLHFFRGPLLRTANTPPTVGQSSTAEDTLGTVQVTEIRNDASPEFRLVREFNQLWTGDTFVKPTPKELQTGRDLLDRYGRTKLHALLPITVKRVREEWPEAKTFGAIAKYVPVVCEEYDKRQQIVAKQKQDHLREKLEDDQNEQKRRHQQDIIDRFRPRWLALPGNQRQDIEQAIRKQWPYIAKVPAMFERYCILAFAELHKDTPATTPDVR